MNSKLYIGETLHHRVTPVEHKFSYPMYFAAFDLDELQDLDKSVGVFSHNRFNLFSLYDSDYLPGRPGSIKQRALQILREEGVSEEIARVELLTCPRYLGRVFNPVNFYRCYRADGEFTCAIAEVNNTFGETHLYVLVEEIQNGSPAFVHYRKPKQFHVSPFNDMKGDYRFHVSKNGGPLDIRVNIDRDGKTAFCSSLVGQPHQFSSKTALSILLRQPITGLITMPRITWQAALLYFRRKLPVYTKPIASSKYTIRQAAPSAFQNLCKTLVCKRLKRIVRGKLVLKFADGGQEIFGDLRSKTSATILVKNYDFFWSCIYSGDIGFGEAYVKNYWDSEDPKAVLEILVNNLEELDDRSIATAFVGRLWNRFSHLLRANSIAGSKNNIRAHYDLSNDFFKLFLDPSMTYSAAIFAEESESLEQAQMRKLDAMIDKARLTANHHVLEIGTGWGSMAIRIASRIGCKVTSVTLSEEQRKLALQRIEAAGFSELIDVQLLDYRKIEGKYDRIVSVEMLEAVGHENYGTFFSTCDKLLKPDGIAVLQVISIPDQRYEDYRKGCDWIQKHIFPGGLCPSLTAISQALTKHSRFVIEDLDNIGIHYARTLKEWRERFFKQEDAVRKLGFDDRFIRMWEYYLCYCEAGFAGRAINTLQLVLSRPSNPDLEPCPGYSNA